MGDTSSTSPYLQFHISPLEETIYGIFWRCLGLTLPVGDDVQQLSGIMPVDRHLTSSPTASTLIGG